ncbi:Pimeloyl-ACP methyl ester carboxylesterase [Hymenobacter daecheongensis DSM 21074]|uniref:Pimeloyl-ACP methyl ester carboxylesterase n=1 Tax=Hymenobacter daecheongensis DSM 21074 TaxID=1121955 RepID=A0A1M6GYC2_9BACT|nr:alpha/beta hydrolase [Hymenobacter daecheongensis]SHJ14927.1 Pimeloyl-ACP methyl ester carboxylesterase [Hymenobacter daecheongensis DSM 21074]
MKTAVSVAAPYCSEFKDPARAEAFLGRWVQQVEALNGCQYGRLTVPSLLGPTVVWTLNAEQTDWPAVVIFPGFRTVSLFWDLDNNLAPLKQKYRLFLIDVNGQPCLSHGATPAVKGDGYGHWAADLLRQLGLAKAHVLGASFGGLLALKLSQVAPELVDKVVLLNPGCLQSFSLGWRNLYYNLLPLLRPTMGHVLTFLDAAVFCPPHHQLSAPARQLLADFELFAIREYRDRTPKPYAMPPAELARVTAAVYLLVGEHDLLFPYQKSVAVARQHLRGLRGVQTFPHTGHGIETSREALMAVAALLE